MMHIRWATVVCCLAVSSPDASAEKQEPHEPEKRETLIAPAGMDAKPFEPLLGVPWRSAAEDGTLVWTERMPNLEVFGAGGSLLPESTALGSKVFFPPGGSEVDASGEALLRRHAILLKQNASLELTLVAYADSEGSSSYNLAVAEERLDSVTEILRRSGVPRGRIERLNSGRVGADVCKKFACCPQRQRVELIYQ